MEFHADSAKVVRGRRVVRMRPRCGTVGASRPDPREVRMHGEWQRDGFTVSTDYARLDLDMIHGYLSA